MSYLENFNGKEEWQQCGYESEEEWLRDEELYLRKEALKQIRKQIKKACVSTTLAGAWFHRVVPLLPDEHKARLLGGFDTMATIIRRFGTVNEAESFPSPFAEPDPSALWHCLKWVSEPGFGDWYLDILDQIDNGVVVWDFEPRVKLSANDIHARGATPTMLAANKWINTVRNILAGATVETGHTDSPFVV